MSPQDKQFYAAFNFSWLRSVSSEWLNKSSVNEMTSPQRGRGWRGAPGEGGLFRLPVLTLLLILAYQGTTLLSPLSVQAQESTVYQSKSATQYENHSERHQVYSNSHYHHTAYSKTHYKKEHTSSVSHAKKEIASSEWNTTPQSLSLLRSVPLEIKDYDVAKQFPTRFESSAEVIQLLNASPNLLVRMEALRRGYGDLSFEEQQKLLQALQKQHHENESDDMANFDYGYAQLVYQQNKTGLFFLRKVNDQLHTPFSNLAYAMAEAEADINLEGGKPDVMTERKLDVTYKLEDAAKLNKTDQQLGFWHSYSGVLAILKPLPAYTHFADQQLEIVQKNGADTSSTTVENTVTHPLNLGINQDLKGVQSLDEASRTTLTLHMPEKPASESFQIPGTPPTDLSGRSIIGSPPLEKPTTKE